MTDQYLVDYEEIMDMLSELGDTPFPAVGARVFDSARPAADAVEKTFTASDQFEQSTPVGAVVVLSDGAYQKTACNRWRCLQPGPANYPMALDLVAVLLRSDPRGIVIVAPAATDNRLTTQQKRGTI